MSDQTQNAAENANVANTDTSPGTEVTQAVATGRTPDGSDREEAFKHRLARELERERRRWEQELAAEKRRSEMTEAERLRAEKLELESQIATEKQRAEAAERRRLATESLLEAGVDPRKLGRAATLFLNEMAEKEALDPKSWLASWPEFQASADAGGGFRRANSSTLTWSEYEQMTPAEVNKNWDRVKALLDSERTRRLK